LDEEFHHSLLAGQRCDVESRVPLLGGGVDGCPPVQEFPDHLHVAILRREMDSVQAVLKRFILLKVAKETSTLIQSNIQYGARLPRGQCVWRAIAETKQRSQRSIGWVTKIYNLELLGALEGTLSRWSRLHLQSLAPTPVLKRVDVRQVVKIIESL
jgi:hypothetical protein